VTTKSYQHLSKEYSFGPWTVTPAQGAHVCRECKAVIQPGEQTQAITHPQTNRCRLICPRCRGPMDPLTLPTETVPPITAPLLQIECPVCHQSVSLIPVATYHVTAKHSNLAIRRKCVGSDLTVFNAERDAEPI
jgi:hypothetical protein